MTDQIDESLCQDSGNVANINRVHIGDKRGLVIGALLGLSILVNIVCGWIINDHAKEQRLAQYDLDWFKSTDYSSLKGQVEIHDKLINTLLLKKECRQ